jgi:hypothetical protein
MAPDSPADVIRSVHDRYVGNDQKVDDGPDLPHKARLGALWWNTTEDKLFICVGRVDGKMVWKALQEF